MTTILTGGCFCGLVRYETEAAKVFHESVCHCFSCRRTVGAASVAWFTVPRTAFHNTAGPPTRFKSSGKATRTFCGACGTSLTFEGEAFPDEIDITIASLDDPDRLSPKDHTHVREKLHWTVIGDGLPVYTGPRTMP